MYGPPGTGKTMLAKAVANATTASFISMVGSEFVQKYLGEVWWAHSHTLLLHTHTMLTHLVTCDCPTPEPDPPTAQGPRMVRDVFRLARQNEPSIVFIDEIDAIGTKRFDSQTGADREVQRILLELLNQMDGFDQTTNVKVIMATNRADTLDPALLRPGRLDRKVHPTLLPPLSSPILALCRVNHGWLSSQPCVCMYDECRLSSQALIAARSASCSRRARPR